ncbi:hypothetical protein [Paraburkholderia xenovorans]|uniref:hypothetical protein n=1 Tax=Paraburkholderia xenovorans TaxID=36873 RepID=UPI0038BB4F2E
MTMWSAIAFAQFIQPGALYPVAMKQPEYVDTAQGDRHLSSIMKSSRTKCDQYGRDTWPEMCIDAPGVDRTELHEYIGNAALKFFDTNLNVMRSPQN